MDHVHVLLPDAHSALAMIKSVNLFELLSFSLGKSAQLGTKPILNFMDEMGRMGIPVINLDDDQNRDELKMHDVAAIADKRGLTKKVKPHIDILIGNGIYMRQTLIEAVLADTRE